MHKADWRTDGKVITGCRYPPASTTPSANRRLAPRWLPQSRLRRASSLPEGAIFRQLLRFHIGFLRIGSGCCESLWQKSKIIASSHRPGAFGGSARRQCARRGAPGVNAHDNLLRIVTAPPVPGIVTLQRGSSIPPSGREVAWGAAPRRREPSGRKPI